MAVQKRRDSRRRQTRSGRRRRGLPETLMEIFAVPLMLFVMSNPEFGLKNWMPPIFNPDPVVTPPDPSSKPTPYVLAVGADGKLSCDGEESSVQTFVSDIERTIKPNQDIRLLVESGDDGTGNIASFLQVQAVLSQTDLWNRTRIPHRTSQPNQPSNERSDL